MREYLLIPSNADNEHPGQNECRTQQLFRSHYFAQHGIGQCDGGDGADAADERCLTCANPLYSHG